MSEVMDVLNAFGTPLKLAWVGWVAWGVGQYFWFRHERSTPLVKKVTSVAKPVAKKAAVPKTVAAQAAEAPVVGRLITPTHVTAEAKSVVPVAPQAAPKPQAAPPTPAPVPVSVATDAPATLFDPSNAVIEQFGTASDSDNAQDKFVREFEMQDARPRRRKPRPTEMPSYGAEAPHVQ
jgi:hypothetical protein